MRRNKGYRKQGKGKFSQGKGGTKTCDDSSIGSCVRASVTEARVTVYVHTCMPRECVCERKDVHTYCSKMLAAQQKQDYALAELWGGGGGELCKVYSLLFLSSFFLFFFFFFLVFTLTFTIRLKKGIVACRRYRYKRLRASA